MSRGISADRVGIWTSGLCVVHCLLTPIVLSLSAVSVHYLPSEEVTHRSLVAIPFAALGAIALVRGFRQHRRLAVLALMGFGLGCVWGTAWYRESLPGIKL